MYFINDKNLIGDINSFSDLIEKREEELKVGEFQHPLDKKARGELEKLIKDGRETIEYSQVKKVDNLWIMLIDKSIKCLRFFDDREPFLKNHDKTPIAYGIDDLRKYHNRYADFENLLYGASSYYRDHVFHAVRTWMLGVFCLLKDMDQEKLLVDQITIDGSTMNDEFVSKINFFEKISMWTIIALCHDLGYPLEKSQQILDKTKKMMKDFISNPNIWNNFGFNGMQDNIHDYIIKFMSTKMKEIEREEKCQKTDEREENVTHTYYGRIQPKYYLKYTKSLEHFDHGVISAVIIYKMLLYFLESDFNLNDDYYYKYQDARQFYIRREILRAIASHTCPEIYSIYLTTFSSILFLCDEMQEWGRKSWNDIYTGLQSNSVKLTINKFNSSEVDFKEDIEMNDINEEKIIEECIARIFERQFKQYKVKFRDGQYTYQKKFNIKKEIILNFKHKGTDPNIINIKYQINAQQKNVFSVNLKDLKKLASDQKIDKKNLQSRLIEKLNKSDEDEIEVSFN